MHVLSTNYNTNMAGVEKSCALARVGKARLIGGFGHKFGHDLALREPASVELARHALARGHVGEAKQDMALRVLLVHVQVDGFDVELFRDFFADVLFDVEVEVLYVEVGGQWRERVCS